MIKRRPVLMWVDPSFKTSVKIQSAQQNKTVIEFTKALADSGNELMEENPIVNKKKFTFKI